MLLFLRKLQRIELVDQTLPDTPVVHSMVKRILHNTDPLRIVAIEHSIGSLSAASGTSATIAPTDNQQMSKRSLYMLHGDSQTTVFMAFPIPDCLCSLFESTTPSLANSVLTPVELWHSFKLPVKPVFAYLPVSDYGLRYASFVASWPFSYDYCCVSVRLTSASTNNMLT